MKWYTRLRSLTGRHAGSVTLVTVGSAQVLAAVVIRNDEVVAGLLVAFGSVLVALGASLPDVVEFSGGKEGFKLKKREKVPTADVAASNTLALPAGDGDDETLEDVVRARVGLAAVALEHLLSPEEGPLAGATLHLYLYDAEDDRLRALGVSGPPGMEGWRPGTGATGVAWERGEYVLATGDAVSDATYGLTPDQQDRARDLAVVAAMPVFNASGDVIAVVTASSGDPASPVATDEGFDALVAIAQFVSRILVDVLRWAPDMYNSS